MQDDSGDLFRRSLWLASGCAALGGILMLRTQGAAASPPGLAWTALLLGLLVAAPAVETGYAKLDLTLTTISLGASVLGLLLLVGGWLAGWVEGDMLDLGPIFALAGFGIGAVGNGIHHADIVAELWDQLRQSSAARDFSAEDESAAVSKTCPHCGHALPVYAGACRYCKSILDP